MSGSNLILGVDGGGTGTVAWLARGDAPEEILGKGEGGPSNLRSVGPSQALVNLEESVHAAFDAAGLKRIPVGAACLGLAGSDRESDRKMIEDWGAAFCLGLRVTVVNDALPLLYAGTPAGKGVALIVGTGSLAVARNQSGATARSGGWGHLFGDEGSGYAIAIAGLRAAARSADGRGPETKLLPRFLGTLHRTEPGGLVTALYDPSMTRARIAALAHVVFDSAEEGDSVSLVVITQAAQDLVQLVRAVIEKTEMNDEKVALALSGGVAIHQHLLQVALQREFQRESLEIGPVELVLDPVIGAVRLAASLLLC